MRINSPLRAICILVAIIIDISPSHSQTLEEIIAVQVIDTIHYTGSRDNRINFAIQNRGDGFTSNEEFVQLFKDDLYQAFTPGNELAKSPYAEYRDFFNLFAFWWPDAPDDDSGWNFETLHGVRDHFFLPWANNTTGWITFFSTSRWGGGGGAGLNRDQRVGSGKMYGMGWETFLHEFGHTMPGQLDEYTSSGIWSGGQCWETPNTTSGTFIDDIPWRKWIEPATPIPTPYSGEFLNVIGAFEGALTNFYGCHRPTARGCIMGAGGFDWGFGDGLCAPCRQRIVCYLYKYVNPIENAVPAQQQLQVIGNETVHFSVDVIHPVPNTQVYQWTLNGKVIANNVLQVDIEFGACDVYELKFILLDTTTFVRYDEKFQDIYPRPYKEWVWTIDQKDINNSDLSLSLNPKSSDCTGIPAGFIDIEVSGGIPPYDFSIVRDNISGNNGSLGPGTWQVFATDNSGCGISDSVMILQEPILDASIRATLDEGVWTLVVESDNYQTNNLSYQWSNGSSLSQITTGQDGVYSVTITTESLCIQTRAIELIGSDSNLLVFDEYFNSTVEKRNGQIFLTTTGGRPQYDVMWKDSPAADATYPDPSRSIASGTTWDHLPEYAFDNSLATKWLHFTPDASDPTPWIGFDFQKQIQVLYYVITSADDVPARDPKNWEFQGSNDGIDWTILDSQTDQSFETRFQERTFIPEVTEAFSQFRLFITENHGDGATQIQELDVVTTGSDFSLNNRNEGQFTRTDLDPGAYVYIVNDQNSVVVSDTVLIGINANSQSPAIRVVKKNDYSVQIENPQPELEYYWFTSGKGGSIINQGTIFQPLHSGNFYVGAAQENGSLGALTGFAISMPDAPTIDSIDSETISIVNPQIMTDYIWYDSPTGGIPLSTGTTFQPGSKAGFYYASARDNILRPDPIDPTDLGGILIHMDASDIDGDGFSDDPAPETSSMLEWYFPGGNRWSQGSYFAYESNTQNGLGTANFATIWLQRIETPVREFQTIVLAYEEDELSFPETAPFEALSYYLPRHNDSTQFLSASTPATTANGRVYYNGNLIDPIATPNPMKFGVLSAVLAEPADRDFFYTDTHWEGRVGELILWDKKLTEEEIKSVSEFLRKKWLSTADLESSRTPFYWEGATVDIESIQSSNTGFKIKSLPNPIETSGSLTIEKPNNLKAVLIIYNELGIHVFRTDLYAPQVHVNMNSQWVMLPAGLYHAVLMQNNMIKAAYKIAKIK